MQVEVSETARKDISLASAWFGQNYPEYGKRVLRRIDATIASLSRNALHYQLRDELPPGTRLIAVERYSVLYHVETEVVIVDRVLYSRRDVSGLLRARGVRR